jgi:hypothetical protein
MCSPAQRLEAGLCLLRIQAVVGVQTLRIGEGIAAAALPHKSPAAAQHSYMHLAQERVARLLLFAAPG